MNVSAPRTTEASRSREVAYPVAHVWRSMATLLPYCSVCDVSAIVDTLGTVGLGTKFRAFPGRVAGLSGAAQPGDEGSDGDAGTVEGGMPGEIIEWSVRGSVATRLSAGNETAVVRVEMEAASPDTTLVTISVAVTPLQRNWIATVMARSSYARMARRTVEGEIAKLPSHLELTEELPASL